MKETVKCEGHDCIVKHKCSRYALHKRGGTKAIEINFLDWAQPFSNQDSLGKEPLSPKELLEHYLVYRINFIIEVNKK